MARNLFLILSLLGGAILFFANSALTQDGGVLSEYGAAWMPILLLSLIIIIYGFWGTRQDKAQLNKVADSCYYMGFIYTLMSIGITLYQIGITEDPNNIQNAILSNFGVALVTTLVGLMMRMYIGHFQVSTEETLGSADNAFAQSLDKASAAVNKFSDTIQHEQDRVKGGLEDIFSQVTEIPEKLSVLGKDTVSKIEQSFADEAKEASERLKTYVEESEKVSQLVLEEYRSVYKTFGEAKTEIENLFGDPKKFTDLSNSLGSFKASTDDLKATVSGANTELTSLAATIKEVSAQAKEIGKEDYKLKDKIDQFNAFGDSLAAIIPTLKSSVNEIESLNTSAKSFSDQISNISVSEIFTGLGASTSAASSSMRELAGSAKELAEANNKAATSLTTIESALTSWEAALARAAEGPELEAIRSEIETSLSDIRTLRTKLHQERDQATTLVDELYKDLTRLAQRMVSAIR